MTNSFYTEFESNLAVRGFTYGGGRISPDQKYFYINIPKNASSYLDQLCSYNGWPICNVAQINHVTPIIVLRDPVDRWVSGITQYLHSFVLNSHNVRALSGQDFIAQYSDIFERLLFDQVIVDDHTMPQYYFIDGIDHEKAKYFYFGPTLDNEFRSEFNLSPVKVNENRGSDNINKQVVSAYIQQRLNNDPTLLATIKRCYQKDYTLISQANLECHKIT
jgi:hypothetical protein